MPIGGDNRLNGPAMDNRTLALAAAITEFARHRLGGAVDRGDVLIEMLPRACNANFNTKAAACNVLGLAVRNESGPVAIEAGTALLPPQPVEFVVTIHVPLVETAKLRLRHQYIGTFRKERAVLDRQVFASTAARNSSNIGLNTSGVTAVNA